MFRHGTEWNWKQTIIFRGKINKLRRPRSLDFDPETSKRERKFQEKLKAIYTHPVSTLTFHHPLNINEFIFDVNLSRVEKLLI